MGLLGQMTVRFGGDTSGLQGAAGQAKNILSGIGSGNPLGMVAMGFVAAGAAAVGFASQAVKMAGDFQEATTTLVTGAGESQKNIGMVRQGILDLAVATGTTTKQLVSGMFMIESSGQHGAAGLAVLGVAARGAKVGAADLGVTANALTTILTDYHMKTDTAAQATQSSTEAMNALTAVVSSGKTHLQDVASAMGSILPLASSLGISFPQVGAAIATMTNAGMGAQRASMNLANAIRSLAAPGSAAQKSMKEVGLSAQELKDTLSTKGLAAAIQEIEDHVGKKFPAGSVQAVEAFKKIMGGATGYNVSLMLGGKNMDIFTSNIKNISSAMNTGTSTINGWSDVQKDWNYQVAVGKEKMEVLGIKIGTALIPILTTLMSHVTPIIEKFTDWIFNSGQLQQGLQAVGGFISSQLLPPLKNLWSAVGPIISGIMNWIVQNNVLGIAAKLVGGALAGVVVVVGFIINVVATAIHIISAIVGWFIQWHEPIMIVAGIILAFFVPALIQVGVQSAIAGGKMAASFISNMITTGVEAVKNAAKVTISFVGSMIKAGVEAWTQGGKVVGGFVASMITSGVEAVKNAGKVTGSFVASMVTSGIEAGKNAAKVTGAFVASMITTGLEAVKNAAKVTASFIASMVQTGVQAGIAAAKVVGSFVASMVTSAAQAIVTGATFMASLIPAILSATAAAIGFAIGAIPSILIGFGAWIVGALAVAAANIAAFWPIYLIVAVIIGIIALVILAIKNWGAIAHWLQGVWGAISGFFKGLWSGIVGAFHVVIDFFAGAISKIGGAFSGLGSMIKGIWNGIVSAVKGAINIIIGGIDQFIGFIDGIQIHIPSIGVGPVHTPQFDWNGLGIPKIPFLASGGMIASSGWAIVGEQGPEMVKLPTGANVYPKGYGPPQSGSSSSQQMRQDIYVQLDSQTIAHVAGNRQARLVRLKMGRRSA